MTGDAEVSNFPNLLNKHYDFDIMLSIFHSFPATYDLALQ